jgi:DNA repair protein RadC
VREIAPHDRPREKLVRLGAAGLGDNELLAVVLGNGARQTDALMVANAILEATGGLHGVARTGHDDLRRVHGVGAAKAAQVLAAIELGRRTLVRRPGQRKPFASPRELATYLLPQFGARSVEQFGVVLLDTKHRVTRTTIVTVGTLDASIVHPREIFREATAGGAAAIVVFHNHPSGDPEPSKEDIELTHRLVAAGVLMGIEVIDHVILANVRYCSMKEEGLI